jgi:hypothetical protein
MGMFEPSERPSIETGELALVESKEAQLGCLFFRRQLHDARLKPVPSADRRQVSVPNFVNVEIMVPVGGRNPVRPPILDRIWEIGAEVARIAPVDQAENQFSNRNVVTVATNAGWRVEGMIVVQESGVFDRRLNFEDVEPLASIGAIQEGKIERAYPDLPEGGRILA